MERDFILFVWVLNYLPEKKHIWNCTRMLFFNNINFFMKAFIQEHKVLTNCAFGPFIFMYVVKIVFSMKCLSAFSFFMYFV